MINLRQLYHTVFVERYLVQMNKFIERDLEGWDNEKKKPYYFKMQERVGPVKYINYSPTSQTITATEVAKGATVCSFFAALIIRKAAKKKYPDLDISLISMSDYMFLSHVYDATTNVEID